MPVSGNGGIVMILTTNAFIRIIFFMALTKDIYNNQYLDNGSTPKWIGWQKISS